MSEFKIGITGVTSGLESAANKAGGILEGLASGSVDGLTSSVGGLLGKLGPLGIAAGAALTALTALAAGGAKMAIEYANLSKEFGVNIEQIQKLEKTYSSFGMNAEKILDINKDASEKLGEAWKEGTGEFQAALEMVKGDIKDYAAFTNDPEGGRKAAEMWYYQAKAAGLSHSEIIAGMERIASDSSKMIGALEKSNDYWEHQAKVAQESVYVSEEAANSWSDASTNLVNAGKMIMGKFADLFKFIPDGFNIIYSYFTNDFSKSKLYLSLQYIGNYVSEHLPKLFSTGRKAFDPLIQVFDKLRQVMVNLYKTMYKIFAKVANFANGLSQKALSAFGIDAEVFNFKLPESWEDLETKITEIAAAQSKLNDEKERQNAIDAQNAAKKAQEEYERKNKELAGQQCPVCKKGAHAAADCPENKKKMDAAKKAAQKAADDAKKLREKAYADLKAINISLYSSVQASVASSNRQITENLAKLDNALKQGIITQEQYEEKRRQLIDANAENFRKSVLGASSKDALEMLAASKQVYEQSLKDLEESYRDKNIKLEEYLAEKQRIEDAYAARTNSTEGLANKKLNEYTTGSVNADADITGFGAAEKAEADEKSRYDAEIADINKRDIPEIQRLELIEKAEKQHANNKLKIDKQYADARMKTADIMYQGLTSMMNLFGAENSKAAKVAFMAYKGFQLGNAIVAMNTAEALALSDVTVPSMATRLLNAKMARVQGMANVASIAASSISGMAHDGIDEIPREGTWLLQKGERVVDDRTNGQLKEFLANNKAGNYSNSQPIEVNAPLNINGNVNSSDKMVMDAIKRHAKLVAQAVEDAQRRKM
ncbi:hypothetical protein MW391_000706 [Shigella sonnei]|nr:hypothetical protein [Shigella sonnei]EJQ1914279.1 hypothetical protein [Escherichia coli]EIR2052317.1 hypothetical protein [Shigella sonnei]EJB4295346.1 hypothetical protein [Shigella sonnei]EJF5745471.1 hypothetical protein [Shigella sonnei]